MRLFVQGPADAVPHQLANHRVAVGLHEDLHGVGDVSQAPPGLAWAMPAARDWRVTSISRAAAGLICPTAKVSQASA